MAILTFDADAPVIRGWNSSTDLALRLTQSDLYAPGSSAGPYTIADMLYSVVTSASVASSWLWSAEVPLGDPTTAALSSLSPTLLSLDGDRITSIGSGRGLVRLQSTIGSRDYPLDASLASGTAIEFAGYAPTSLAAHINSLMESYCVGQPVTMGKVGVFSGGAYNPSRIAADLNLSTVSWLRNGASQQFPDILVSPRHAIVAGHAFGSIHDTVTYLRSDGSTQTVGRKMIQSVGPDTTLIYYDQPVAGIPVARLPPSNLFDKLPLLAYGDDVRSAYRVPGMHLLYNSYAHMGLSSGRKLLVTCLAGENVNQLMVTKAPSGALAAYGPRSDMANDSIRGGDSGSPLFLPVQEAAGGAVVPMWMTHCWSAYRGPNYARVAPGLDAAMNSIKDASDSTTYAASTVDLSRFPAYA